MRLRQVPSSHRSPGLVLGRAGHNGYLVTARVRDTCDMFSIRIALVLERNNPTFPNYDQDVIAVELRYDQQHPQIVATELRHALDALLEQLDAIPDDDWGRPDAAEQRLAIHTGLPRATSCTIPFTTPTT